MRFVIDLATPTARRLIEAVESGHFETADAAIETALSAFLPPEGPGPSAELDASGGASPVGSWLASSSPEPWLWGMINRVFPLKVVTRACADLCSRGGKVTLARLQADAAQRAAAIAEVLASDDRLNNRKRNELRCVALPSSRSDAKSMNRFATQFVGRRTASGNYAGGVFDTGLVGSLEGNSDHLAPTDVGWKFSALPNSVLENRQAGSSNLSHDEQWFYLQEVARRVPAERDAFMKLLNIVKKEPLTPDRIAARFRQNGKGRVTVSVTDVTARSGAIGRLADVGAITREPSGRTALIHITELGRDALRALNA